MSSDSILASANKALLSATSSSKSFFSFASSSDTKYETAYDLFLSAARSYKVDRRWRESGDAFLKAAQVAENRPESSEHDAASACWEASKVYKKDEALLEQAAEALERCVQLTQKTRLRSAADRKKEAAEIYAQLGRVREAYEAYVQAGEWYETEDARATAKKVKLEAADIASQSTAESSSHSAPHEAVGFHAATVLYEEAARTSVGDPMTKYSVKEYLLKAGLCRLCEGDMVTVKRKLEEYRNWSPDWETTREAKFLHNIVAAVEAGNTEEYTAHLIEYDKISRLTSWQIPMLGYIKKNIHEDSGLA